MNNKINDIGSIQKIIELEDKINELEHEKEKLSKENLDLGSLKTQVKIT